LAAAPFSKSINRKARRSAAVPTVGELSAGFRDGSLSPVRVASECLEKARRLNPELDCFITLLGESALGQAEQSEARAKAGRLIGPLDGVPVAVKDLIFIDGVRCTAGSAVLAEHVAAYDAPAVRRLKAAGAVLIGTTNLHEFAAGVTSENPHFGPVRNPWDTSRVAGGSSGGSAAAVAAGICPLALGTDTGGSIRIPGALCGAVGVKPTYGTVSRLGVVPLAPSFDTVGVLAMGASDAAAALQAIAGHDGDDMTTADMREVDYADAGTGLPAPRVGVARRYFFEALDPALAEATEKFVDWLRAAGCAVSEVDVSEAERASDVWRTVRAAESAAFHERWLSEVPEKYGDDVRASLGRGASIPAVQYINAQNSRPYLRQRFLESMEGVDVILAPATSVTAPRVGQKTVAVGGKEIEVRSALIDKALPFSAVGFPVLELPIASVGGLPLGVQLVARPFEEPALFRLGGLVEREKGAFPLAPVG
jgi:aspartyl-tRNA(Asn)/glutamyl-tRNA(Gln) amidotransferase subunit A